MASSTRQSTLFGVNDWQAIYKTFSEANFTSYDYETLRKSFVDYIRLRYPETFNDYIESSEFVALLDVIAFMGQALAFRNDLNARENFMDTAERRDSVIKLANLVGYTPKRNIAASGFVKVITISTSESVFDINGTNLGGQTILWNDPANINWLSQFNSIINATLVDSQRIGRPGNSKTILGVKTDEYSISMPTTVLPIVSYSSQVDNIDTAFELVSGSSVGSDTIVEQPPQALGRMNILYRNDKLGYGSANTGYFFLFKQGTLQTYDFTLTQQVSNQLIEIGSITGVNNSDTWLYQFDSSGTAQQWRQVDTVYGSLGQNTIDNSTRRVFSVISGSDDTVSYSFGDGVFSEIPVGVFRAYVRTSNGLTYTIDPSEMRGISVTLPYLSRSGKTETLTLGIQLNTPVSNAQSRETLASIKQRAPSRFYTQNRMVNGEDYSVFPYTQYGSIIKSSAVNRSSIGISKNLDLIDPTQKYSSTVTFGSDGALYQDTTPGSLLLSISNVNNIITFLTGTLSSALNTPAARQYYTQKYTRYSLASASSLWQLVTTTSSGVTGYFYVSTLGTQVPVSVGTYSTSNLKYATTGALIQFTAPVIAGVQYYFDPDNRLTTSSAAPNSLTTWIAVTSVEGDGSNNGKGVFPNGTGPITLNTYLPSGSVATTIIPVFSNTFGAAVVQECVNRMEVNQNFSLLFNNALLSNQERWSVGSSTDPNAFVIFTSTGVNQYLVTYKSLAYYFGSISDTRFVFNGAKSVYDPRSGRVLQDFVSVLGSNTSPGSASAIGSDIVLYVNDQATQSDGYINDYEVQVANTDKNNPQIIIDPDFFTNVTGYDFSITPTPTNTRYFVFFKQIQDTATLYSYQLLDTTTVVYQYGTKTQIELVKYDYPVGQLFYTYTDDKFYISQQNAGINTPSYTLVLQTAGAYLMKSGRQGLSFQYRHNSNNTTRIDPATTNIIDLYVVTQEYYTNYINWIQDTTGTVTEPIRPSITQLNDLYSANIDQYKMISDSVVFNSVTFKPLFGSKAASALQGTIKVVKSSSTVASDSEIRSAVVSAMNDYFSINVWNFGDTFYFSELSAYLHSELRDLISSVVLVPANPNLPFGTLYEVRSAPYEIFVNGATAQNISVISALTPSELQYSV